ncbi:MAG: hypothetical protein CMJ64_05755 [Planctomycetaceae bacterium]|nr:hypothetical protein [Planctomycetaceae bacterium]
MLFSQTSRFGGIAPALLFSVLLCSCGGIDSCQRLDAQERGNHDASLNDYLAAGEFGPARQMIDGVQGNQRDRWLEQLAAAQARAGMRGASYQSAGSIYDDNARTQAFDSLSQRPIGGMPSRGGAALADFDSLMELITSTISPDSWDEVGGPGAIEPFPTGVLVDASGLMRRLALEPGSTTETLGVLRDSSASKAGKHANVRRSSALRKVSLTRLERQLQRLHAEGKRPTAVMQNLAGLRRVKYIFLYPETRDIVLAGPAGDWSIDHEGCAIVPDSGAPVLQLDDFVVVLRNAFSKESVFGCAITPRQENLATVKSYLSESAKTPLKPHQRDAWLKGLRDRLGKQDVSVFGIDPRTHAGRVLVEADYRMKLVGMGLEEGTKGVTSYLDSVKVPEGGSPPPMDVLRWWFTLNYDAVRTTKSGDAFELRGPGVKVLSENEMLTERGERVHTSSSSLLNSEFAHSFTEHFGDLATKYPIYAELRNVFDLALVAAIVRSQDLHGQLDSHFLHYLDAERYRPRFGTAPKQVETVMNHRVINRKHIIVGVSGGVSYDAKQLVRSANLKRDEYGLLSGNRDQGMPKLPASVWWWD